MANLEKTWYFLLSQNDFFGFDGGSGSLISRPDANGNMSVLTT